MYLENNLRVPGKLEMLGVKVDLGKVDMPAYLMAPRRPHRAVEERLPGAQPARRRHHLRARRQRPHRRRDQPGLQEPSQLLDRDARPADPDEWLEAATEHKGSWWLHWDRMAAPARRQGRSPRAATPGQHEIRADRAGPGRYVKERA
jgi:polyhydroxyalkanoate synthase